MSEIPLKSRLDKSLNFTQEYIKKSKGIKNNNPETGYFDGEVDTNLALLMENQRIEDAYLIKESESNYNDLISDRKFASKLVHAEEQVRQLKAAHDQAETNLGNVLNDLQTAILENQKLNSEKRIDHENITAVHLENQNLKRKLSDLQDRFSKFVQESIKMTSREGELIGMLENAEDKLLTQGAELERESVNSQRLQEENDALMEVSLGLEKMIKDSESREVKYLAEIDKVTTKLHDLETNHFNNEWNVENLNAEILALKEKCSRQEHLFREKFQSEVSRLKSEYSAEKCKLAKEMECLADKAHELQMVCDRAIREKRSAEAELHNLMNILPNQTDSLEGTIDELNRRLVSSEKQRIEALHSAEAIHQKYLNQLAFRDLEERSYQSAIYNAAERAKKAEAEFERATMESLKYITKISELEQAAAVAIEEKKLLISSHELEKNQHIEEYKRKLSQLEISLSEARQSADNSSKEIHQLLNQQQMLSSRWKHEADSLCKKHDASISLIKSQMAKMQQRFSETEEERLKLKAIKSDLIKQIGLGKQENAALNERINLSESRNLSLERQIAAMIGKESLRILERNGITSLDLL